MISAGIPIPDDGECTLGDDFSRTSDDSLAVHQNAKRKTAADHGCRTCMLFLFTVIQPQYRMDRDRYHGFRVQHGGNLSDDGFLCRKSH